MARAAAMLLLLPTLVSAQSPGKLKEEKHPTLRISTCTKANGCQSATKSVTIDSNWRWLHEAAKPTNCFTGNQWDKTLCPDPQTCLKSCVIEGADAEYVDTYGIQTTDDALSMRFLTKGKYSTNIGARTFLLDSEDKYKMFHLKNREFAFDVNVSSLPCGLNGALYFVQMDADGGSARYSTNQAGAKYGTGYCDAQCPHDLKFINGEPNVVGWAPSKSDPNAGTGHYGTCCVEMDIWEANKVSTAYTAHACDVTEQTRCEGVDCGDNSSGDRFKGKCDKNGCDLQTYRLGNATFYGDGSSFVLDTSKTLTVVTQFVTDDGTDTGKLSEIRRFYVQSGRKVPTPALPVGPGGVFSALSPKYCAAEAKWFSDGTNFIQKGGFGSMDDAATKGMVLVMSLWDDHDANMLWLDSTYPINGTSPGDARGTCAITSGKPKQVEADHADATVTYSNIRFGEIGSTTAAAAAAARTTIVEGAASTTAATNARATRADKWGLCELTSATGACPTGWECSARADGAFGQCTPTEALVAAFQRTQPSAAEMSAFIATGVTHFPAAGLPEA